VSQYFFSEGDQRGFVREISTQFSDIKWVRERNAGTKDAVLEPVTVVTVLSFNYERTPRSRTAFHIWHPALAPGIPALEHGPVAWKWLRSHSIIQYPSQSGLILFKPSLVLVGEDATVLMSGDFGRMSKGDYEYEGFVKDPEALIKFADKLERRLKKYYNDKLKRSLSGWEDPDQRWPTTLYHVSDEAYEMYKSGVKLKVSGTPQFLYVEEP